MRRLAILLIVPAFACAPSEAPAPIATRGEAMFTGTVLAAGPPGARLGTSVVPCGDGFLAAGPSAVWFAGGVYPSPTSPLAALACVGPVMSPTPVVGATGAWRYLGGTWIAIDSQQVRALLQTPDRGLLAAHNGKIVALDADGGVISLTNATALGWHPVTIYSGNLVALDSVAQVVRVFQAVSYAQQSAFTAPSGMTFTDSLAVGQFHPGSPWQIAIGTTSGHVLIFDSGGTRLMTLKSSTPSFGAALGVRSNYYPSVDGLYVGEPDLDAVYVMVGDAGVEEWSIDGGRFGASLAVSPGGDLAIGAPLAGDGGLVFLEPASLIMPIGDPAICNAGEPCPGPVGCSFGTCVGGVVCAGITTGCPPGERCELNSCVVDPNPGTDDAGTAADGGMPDAGVADAGAADAGAADAGSADGGPVDAGSVDAGSVDAGEADAGSVDAGEADAGEKDAGARDAGSPDAGSKDGGGEDGRSDADGGVVVFLTSGCSSTSALPMLLAALVVLSRRRSPAFRSSR